MAGQVALARRVSPSRGGRHLAVALALVHHLPRTLAALEVRALSEWRAEIVVRETAVLAPEHQSAVDAELFDGLGTEGVGRLGHRELVRRVRAIAYRLDAESVLNRCRGAEEQRRVLIRPAPDTMSYVTAYLPVAQGVAVHAVLTAAAAASRAGGDGRPKGQLMADLLVERVTGQATAAAVPVEVQVVITDRTLLTGAFGSGDETTAQVPGYGTVPARWARELVADHDGEAAARVWLRRLYTHPDDGTLVAMDSTRRLFDGGLRRLLVARDGTGQTPWCDAPVRHIDHVVDHASGGPTSAHNGQGACERCNHTKQQPGWRARPEPAPPPGAWRAHTVVTVTPTGHRYASTAPPVLPGEPLDQFSPLSDIRDAARRLTNLSDRSLHVSRRRHAGGRPSSRRRRGGTPASPGDGGHMAQRELVPRPQGALRSRVTVVHGQARLPVPDGALRECEKRRCRCARPARSHGRREFGGPARG